MRSIAEVTQRMLLRPVPLTVGPLQAAVSYTSAVAEAHIGGDLYEVVASRRGVRVIVGDVQGKGLAAVETAAVVLGAFREAAHDEAELAGVGARLERSVSREVEGEKFVTAVLAEIGSDHRDVFLNYGHPAPILVRRDGTADFPEPSGDTELAVHDVQIEVAHLRRPYTYEGLAGLPYGHRPLHQPGQGAELFQDKGTRGLATHSVTCFLREALVFTPRGNRIRVLRRGASPYPVQGAERPYRCQHRRGRYERACP